MFDSRGQLGQRPSMLTPLPLHGQFTGVRSSWQIEKATRNDITFRYLAFHQRAAQAEKKGWHRA